MSSRVTDLGDSVLTATLMSLSSHAHYKHKHSYNWEGCPLGSSPIAVQYWCMYGLFVLFIDWFVSVYRFVMYIVVCHNCVSHYVLAQGD